MCVLTHYYFFVIFIPSIETYSELKHLSVRIENCNTVQRLCTQDYIRSCSMYKMMYKKSLH